MLEMFVYKTSWHIFKIQLFLIDVALIGLHFNLVTNLEKQIVSGHSKKQNSIYLYKNLTFCVIIPKISLQRAVQSFFFLSKIHLVDLQSTEANLLPQNFDMSG